MELNPIQELASCATTQEFSKNLWDPVIPTFLTLSQTNPVQTTTSSVRLEVFTAVTMKNGVFWDVRPCGSCKN
jgi:hypothetical protein